MKTRLDLSGAVSAELVVQVPPTGVARLPTLLDGTIQPAPALARPARPASRLLSVLRPWTTPRVVPHPAQQPSARDGFQAQPGCLPGPAGATLRNQTQRIFTGR